MSPFFRSLGPRLSLSLSFSLSVSRLCRNCWLSLESSIATVSINGYNLFVCTFVCCVEETQKKSDTKNQALFVPQEPIANVTLCFGMFQICYCYQFFFPLFLLYFFFSSKDILHEFNEDNFNSIVALYCVFVSYSFRTISFKLFLLLFCSSKRFVLWIRNFSFCFVSPQKKKIEFLFISIIFQLTYKKVLNDSIRIKKLKR